MIDLRDLPLSGLRAFAAVGRELSLSMAAQKLGVTTSAVSHSLRQLELQLGAKLIRRSGNRIVLTRAAERAMPDIDRGFLALSSGLDQLTRRGRTSHFTISSDLSFAAAWLAPRLSIIREALGGMEVRVIGPAAPASLADEGIDLAITYRRLDFAGLRRENLMSDPMVAACAPALLSSKEDAKKPYAIMGLPLIHIDSSMGDDVYPAWKTWFNAVGLKDEPDEAGPRCGLSLMAVQAAIAGHGAVLTSAAILDDHLLSGALVEIGGGKARLAIERNLVWPREGAGSTLAETVSSKLLSECNETLLRKCSRQPFAGSQAD